jgi:hypothetical protein
MSIKLSVAEREISIVQENNTIVRCFKGKSADIIKDLNNIGLFKKLVDKNFIPDTVIDVLDNEAIATQELIEPLIYPFEWSPAQLKEAAIHTLKVQSFLEMHGYQLKDAHPYNVVFAGSIPKFVDLGSISRLDYNKGEWLAYPEFKASFEVPLALAEKKYFSLFSNIFLRQGSMINNHDLIFLARKNALFGYHSYIFLYKIWIKYYCSFSLSQNRLRKIFPVGIAVFLGFIVGLPLPGRKVKYQNLIKKLEKKTFSYDTQWVNYHKQKKLLDEKGEKVSQRFTEILSLLKELNPSSVLELAANEGVLSRAIKSQLPSCKVISTDYDIGAVDNNFNNSRFYSKDVAIGKLDFMGDIFSQLGEDRSLRLGSDVVIALAVTHHLALTQGYTFDSIFFKLSQLSLGSVIVEFMPLGLWDGNKAPDIPKWYSQKNFEIHFQKYFKIEKILDLEENRIAYFGTIKK